MRSISARRVVLISAALAGLGGCTAFPAQGPYSQDVMGASSTVGVEQPYAVVRVTPQNVSLLGELREPELSGTFVDRRPAPDLRLGVGDVLAITVFEASPGGLFTPPTTAGARPGNFVDLPVQQIDRNGNISVPYAGLIQAAGLTIPQVQLTIEDRLRNRAIEPQVVLTLREQRATQVSVLGEVNQPARFPLNPAGEKILDVIAKAGGSRHPGHETYVTLQRNGREARVFFNRLINKPSNNIYVQPGDVVYVSREQRYFMTLGASGENGHYSFDSENLTLAQALSRAGGLLDERADPGAVFLYRLEDKKVLKKQDVDVTGFSGKRVPTVYALDLRDPSGFFAAQQIQMRDQDVIFVGNATTVDIAKFLQFIRLGVATVREADATSLQLRRR